MLVLTRKPGEKIFAGDQIEIQVVRTSPSRVVLCIKAPTGCRIRRMETLTIASGVGSTEIEVAHDR